MKFSKEIVASMDAKKLRYVAESEVNISVYIGYDRELAEALIEGERTGIVFDMDKLFGSLVELFHKYQDIRIEKEKYSLLFSGQPKTYSKDVECSPYTLFQYHYDEPIIEITNEYGADAYCQQTELIDCLADTAIFHILLLIQDDEEMKNCYLEFLNLIQPYKNMLMEQKEAFLSLVITDTMDFLQDQPKGKVQAMPVTLNLPLLMYQLKKEIEHYNFEDTGYTINSIGSGMGFSKDRPKFFVKMDTETWNGLILGMTSRAKFDVHLIDTEQIKALMKRLILKLQGEDNVYCRLFSNRMLVSLYAIVYWEESHIRVDNQAKFEKLFGC